MDHERRGGGTADRALRISDELESLGTLIAALWLQDWVGQRKTSFGTQLWWNLELDRDRYPDWDSLRETLEKRDIMTYINPFLCDDVAQRKNHDRNLFEEAARNGYLVKNQDGGPYTITISSFSAALVDLTNPEAWAWIKDIIKGELIAHGGMADFGEGLPYVAMLFSGVDPRRYHDRYAEEWAWVNREAIGEAGRGDDIVFFNRSGYSKSLRYSTLSWGGDQLVDWYEHDGIKSAVTGPLSSGLSGYSLEHSDIGGYTAIDNPLFRYHRSKELLLRWIELGAPEVHGLGYQYMVGPELMVAPVLDPGADTVKVYLPAGKRVHLWTVERYGSLQHGVYETVPAPIGGPAVFYEEDSELGPSFREDLERQGAAVTGEG